MFAAKVALSGLENIHIGAMLIVVYTLVYRAKALIPIYIYVFLEGLFYGIHIYWVPYLYVWALLWGIVMLLPRNMKPNTARVVYAVVCTLHGAFFGMLCVPALAVFGGNSFEWLAAWVIQGIGADMLHAVGNFAASFLILPMSKLLFKLERKSVPE